ncbi:TraR/DksA C4-type zinc finger protein [Microbulbifer taiwanensis]|uniref:TraR/DksA C4-type zinc finger protein n=1 Tax=Microbulbifer taiwanensis TaxID=986746 RepID=A0ABW1YM04_9GAMM|nr:TraR/DksA C4-type zinc finger protein [Microbulbifer taiwanensis]
MPDDFDRAAALEEAQRQRALDAQRGRGNFDRPSLAECEDCDEAIPEARRATGGVTRCVDCQAFAEQQERR